MFKSMYSINNVLTTHCTDIRIERKTVPSAESLEIVIKRIETPSRILISITHKGDNRGEVLELDGFAVSDVTIAKTISKYLVGHHRVYNSDVQNILTDLFAERDKITNPDW